MPNEKQVVEATEPDNQMTAGPIQAKWDLAMLLTVIDASTIVVMKVVVAQSQVLWVMV
jgi:hypothetical protein